MTLKDFKKLVSSVDSKYDELPVCFNGFFYFGPIGGHPIAARAGNFYQFYFDLGNEL